MNPLVRNTIHWILVAIGIVLIVGGTATGKHGAAIVGLLIAAVNIQQILSRRKSAPAQPK
jgi:hypothetical protein